jgi:hypothetical protein
MVKPPLRTKSIGTMVSEEEYAQLERAASGRGLTLGEWCREVMLASANGQPSQADPHQSLVFGSGSGYGLSDDAVLMTLSALYALGL